MDAAAFGHDRDGWLLVGLLYQPLVAWAPLLAVVTVDYWRRRRHG
ncbi:hypothetical protein [Actinocatenispora sera]|nr:hypothetical protein [Actinocatenispora sera]